MAFDLLPAARLDMGYLSLPPSPGTASQVPEVLVPAMRAGLGVRLLPGVGGRVMLGVLPAEGARQGIGLREASLDWEPGANWQFSGGQIRLPWQEQEDLNSFGQWFPGGLMASSGLLEPSGLGVKVGWGWDREAGTTAGLEVAAVASEGWLGGTGSREGPLLPGWWGRGPAVHGRLRGRAPWAGTWALGARYNLADDQQAMAMGQGVVGPWSWHVSAGASTSASLSSQMVAQTEWRWWWTGDASPQATGSWLVLAARGLRDGEMTGQATPSFEIGLGIGTAPDDHVHAMTGLSWRRRPDSEESELWWRSTLTWRLREDD